MESLFCSFLCFGLYGYGLWTMGKLVRGLVKDLVTALLGLVLTILAALGQAVTGLHPHGLFPLRLSTLSFPWSVSLTLALCLTLQCQLAWKRRQLSPFAGAAWGALYGVLAVLPHFPPLPALCLGLGLGLFSVLEYTLRHYQTGYERSTRDFQTSVLTHQYEEIKTIYLNMRGWRHDYHNHIQVLKAHMAMGQLDALAGYPDTLEEDLSQVDTYVKSGNPSRATGSRKYFIIFHCPLDGEQFNFPPGLLRCVQKSTLYQEYKPAGPKKWNRPVC